MYSPPTFMTKAVLAEVLAEFEWPAPYTIDDEWLPDGIGVAFPGCTLLYVESFESDMLLKFLGEELGLPKSVSLTEALNAIGDGTHVPPTPGLITHFSPAATLEKVQIGIRNLSRMVLTHFSASLLGDHSWLKQLVAYRARIRAANP